MPTKSPNDPGTSSSQGLFENNIRLMMPGNSHQHHPDTAPHTRSNNLSSIDELLERDKQREKDGFPRKINMGRLIKPGKSGKDKVIIIPSTVEDKLFHDNTLTPPEESGTGGTGEGQEGDIVGEAPVRPESGSGQGPGDGGGGAHEIESNAYELGKVLTEKFELPNLKDKGKKRSFSKYVYDLTDKHRGFGQLLDKKATLRKIVETNIGLGTIEPSQPIDPSGLIAGPKDKIYRILSREKDFESQAMIFFLRDYSGSMTGQATTAVVSQHVMIYSWLTFQYGNRVESRFILHDTDAKEVPDFYTYYNASVAGGTKVSSAYRLVNTLVEKDNLASEYNIYIFHGTDGDDWDSEGKETLPELRSMAEYASRIGISIVRHQMTGDTTMQRYLEKSALLDNASEIIRTDVFPANADETRLIGGIKSLTASK